MAFLINSSNMSCECALHDFLLSDIILSFFLSFYGRPCLLTHCRCIGLCYTWSHTVTHKHTVGLLRIRDQLVAELSISQNKTHTTDRHIKPAIPGSKRPRTARLPGLALVTFAFINCKFRSITCENLHV